MSASAWVMLSLEKLQCSQKELALRMGVSPSQITKWKANEHMSLDMERRFREITEIPEHDADFVLAAGSVGNSQKWADLILYLANFAAEQAETGYDTWPLQEEPSLLCWKTFNTLSELGIHIPKEFPRELEALCDSECSDDDFDIAIENFYAAIILKIFKSLNDVFGFYAAYVAELTDDEDVLETGMQIKACLMDLAATKIQISLDDAPLIQRFKSRVLRDYEGWLATVKNAALESGKPLRAEILDLVSEGHDALGFESEAESLGMNASRLHPDIYMNELLVGMRAIHQVLPAIIKELDISDEELSFDPSILQRE